MIVAFRFFCKTESKFSLKFEIEYETDILSLYITVNFLLNPVTSKLTPNKTRWFIFILLIFILLILIRPEVKSLGYTVMAEFAKNNMVCQIGVHQITAK